MTLFYYTTIQYNYYKINYDYYTGSQVDMTPTLQDVSVQCQLLLPLVTSTPRRPDPGHFPLSESDLSDTNGNAHATDVSTSTYMYCPSQESPSSQW